jgi:hypothetical protein
MGNIIKLSETQFKNLVKNVIIEAEQGINPKLVGKALQKGVQAVKGMFRSGSDDFAKKITSNQARNMALRTPTKLSSMKEQILNKFGRVKMSDYVFRQMQPINDEIAVIVKDCNRLNQFKVPVAPKTGQKQYDYVAFINNSVASIKQKINAPKGQLIDLKGVHDDVANLNTYVDEIIQSKQVSPQGMSILSNIKQNVKDALEAIENVVASWATK